MDFTHRHLNINEYFDRIFYLNLDKDAKRNDSILSQFKELNITNFERVAGVEVDDLPMRTKYRNFIKDDLKYIKGQLGCREAHLSAIRLAKIRGYDRILILEDDITFLEHPAALLDANQWLHHDWDMLYFGGLVEPFFRNQIVCAHAYGVNSTLFDDILQMGPASGMEIDNFYAKVIQHMSYNHNQSGKYRIRIIQPFNQIIQNKNYESNIV
jgi:GR25 family glycosyltransferase involved in LPS biosynthesis